MSKHDSSSPRSFTRRQFLHTAALAAGGVAFVSCAPQRARFVSPNAKLNIGVIGAAGKGASDTDNCAGENIVALCDADEKQAAGQLKKYPQARFYRDWRRMLDQEKTLDAVIISAPDHVHAVAATAAMRRRLHVYCQKPLTQTVYEARVLRKMAKQYGVATQMGNQGSAEDGLRRAVEVIQAGLIGQVREVHVWSNRPIWPQGMDRPAGSDPVPDGLDWDLWLGPAPWRPFKAEWPEASVKSSRRRGRVYHPFAWRGWQDFGTGALGDMACHTANLPFRALKLEYPSEVEAWSSGINRESWPLKSKIRFEFPARAGLVPATFWWYDGGNPKPDDPFAHDGNNKPPREVTADVEEMMGTVPGSGCILIGDKGKVFSPDDYGAKFYVRLNDEKELLNGQNHEAVQAIPRRIEYNAFQGSADARQHLEWIAACKGGKPGYSDFDIAAYLTEIILLGCVALRVGQKLEWDGPNMRAKNTRAADHIVKRTNRKGWSL